jgi:sulfide:quinone oxidoreductase
MDAPRNTTVRGERAPSPLSGIGRRRFLQLGAASLASAGLLSACSGKPDRIRTSAHIVIAGAGAAGLTTASRLAQRLDGARITIIDPRAHHLYQPGFTLIAAGLQPARYAVSRTADYLPREVNWIEAGVAEFDPDANTVVTTAGQRVSYDYLFAAVGIDLDYDAIEGMDVSLIGQNGLGSVFHSPEAAEATWGALDRFAETGGDALFQRPDTEMKCAGAPLKYTLISDDILRRRGTRSRSELTYAAHNNALFSVPIVSEKVRMLYQDRDVRTVYSHVLKSIDPGARRAVFDTPEGRVEKTYDFINVVPPMRAAHALRHSPLAWTSGPYAADGWAEVDRHTLRHARYPNVFVVGDAAGVPKGKTAASVKWQAPVAVDHLAADIAGGAPSESRYDGYTSCPLITRLGRAMLVEFDYQDNLTPSFPGVIAPLEELWISWVMKTIALKPTYVAMLRGDA